MEIAISALKAGAFDFVSKPINQMHLNQLMQKALHVPQADAEVNLQLEHRMLIGDSDLIQKLREAIKKLLAHKHQYSLRGNQAQAKKWLPILSINSVIVVIVLLSQLIVARFQMS